MEVAAAVTLAMEMQEEVERAAAAKAAADWEAEHGDLTKVGNAA